jgi:hypothetical protein
MPKDFSKHKRLMVLSLERLNRVNYGLSLFYDKGLKPILLIEIGLQVLLHRLPALLVLVDAFVIMFHFLQIDVRNQVAELLLGVLVLRLLLGGAEVGRKRSDDRQFLGHA